MAGTLAATSFDGEGLLSEPGDLLREWLLRGSWTGPETSPLGDWTGGVSLPNSQAAQPGVGAVVVVALVPQQVQRDGGIWSDRGSVTRPSWSRVVRVTASGRGSTRSGVG